MIAFRKSHINMIKCRIPNTTHEVVASIGRRTGQRRKVLMIAAYIPPSYNAADNKSCTEYLCDVLISLKNRFNDPYIIIGGDFNKREISKAIKDFKDVSTVPTGPTQGAATLDLLTTKMPRVPSYETSTYSYYRRDQASLEKISLYLAGQIL